MTVAASRTQPTLTTINPATGEALRTYETHTPAEIDAALDRARDARAAWGALETTERARRMHAVAAYLREHAACIAQHATVEMGKPITEALAEIEKCAACCDHYAAAGPGYLAEQPLASNASESYVAYRPLGVVLAIMPWNFPYWQAFRAAVPALVAGNVVVLKHATNVTECALEIERTFAACGFPTGTFTTLLTRGDAMEQIVADPRIAAVTLTGSEAAGSSVAATSGQHLKKTVLELGGSDAFIVLADADIEAAAEMAVKARFQNAGQSCIAAKRFIVEDAVYDAFTQAFIAATRALRVGDPHDPATQIGPLARADLRDALGAQVDATLAAGATLLLGGKTLDGPGAYFAPTIVSDVVPGMPLFDEETFGPVAALIRAADVERAIALANASRYGLGGNLWTRDLPQAKRIAARLESGGVFINGMTASDPRLPFGGVKRSGYGRELSSFGIREFVNVQTVWIGPAQDDHQGNGQPAE